MIFQNKLISKDELPTIDEVDFSHLEKGYDRLLKMQSIIGITIFGFFVFVGVVFLIQWTVIILYAIIFLIYVLISGIVLWLGFNAWKYKGFAIREHDLLFKSGILFKQMTIVSFNRIQHIEIHQGPFDRYFNVADLTLFTAGGSASDLTIPGLSPQVAGQLKEWIMKKTSLDEEE
ncbi:MAG: PH domain-containing protein [Saprospiraceae bacterium]